MNNFYPISQPSISDEELACVTDAVRSGWVSSLGKYIDEFELQFADFCGTKYAITTSNGTAALHLALISLDISPADEVIIPDLTFVATANAVTYTGAKVVSIDIDPITLCLDPAVLERAITSRTKAIIPVHLYGHPANMSAINRIAKSHGIYVVEDAAEAHGAEFQGKRVGSLSDCGIFSFYGNKIITCGEGGMLTTNNIELYQKAKYLRDHAMSPEKRYWHTMVGFNYRMTNLQAALGVAQLGKIESYINKRRQIMGWYRQHLKGRPKLKLNPEMAWAKNVYWMICLEVDGLTEELRKKFMQELKNNGVDSRPYFYPVSSLPIYEQAETPVAHRVAPTGVNLPTYYKLTEKGVDYICHQILRVLDKIGL